MMAGTEGGGRVAGSGTGPTPSRVAVITGGASGIGQALAVAYARDGVASVFGYHPGDPHDPAHTLAAVAEAGGHSVAIAADVRSTESCDLLISTALEEYGRVDAVVANAGILRKSAIAQMSDEAWGEVLDVDLTGALRVFRAAAPHLGDGGALVAVASISGGVYGWQEHAHYTAAKAGLLGLMRSLAVELGPRGIRANTVIPGLIETPQSLDAANSLGAEKLHALAGGVPLRRIGTAAEVAELIGFLTGPRSSYITGGEFRIDGGLTVQQPS